MYDIFYGVAKFTGSVSMAAPAYIADDKKVIGEAVANIKEWRSAHPEGELSIVGYSYGGVQAMELTRELKKEGITVDLLVTLDAAKGNMSDDVNRTIPSNVKRNVNYYEQNKTGDWKDIVLDSHGGKNAPEDADKTKVVNINDTKDTYDGKKVDHYNIDDKRKDDIIQDVKESQDPD